MKCLCDKEMSIYVHHCANIHHCDTCGVYEYEPIKCDHGDSKPMLLTMSNGAKMIKMFCYTCKRTHGNPLKQENFDTSKMKVYSNADYRKFRDDKDIEENLESKRITDGKASLKYAISRKEMQSEYSDYLNSIGWKDKRAQALSRDGNACQICGNTAESVHHLTYAHIRDEYLFELVSLCDECHLKHYHPEKIKP